MKNIIFRDKTFTDCSLLPCHRILHPQFSQRKLLHIATKHRNSQKFSPLAVSHCTALAENSTLREKWEKFRELVKNTTFMGKTFGDWLLLSHQRMLHPQISRRKLSFIATKLQKARKFSPSVYGMDRKEHPERNWKTLFNTNRTNVQHTKH